MDEQALRGLIAKVKVGEVSRRAFVQKMAALGLTAPMASQMLSYCGRGAGSDEIRLTSRRSAAAADALKVCGGRARRCSIRTSPSAPRTRTARASSTSRSPAGTRTAT